MTEVVLAEGKTKIIKDAGGTFVHVESKDDITAGDGLKHDLLQGKAVWSTTTTTNCFKLLESHGIATHYREPVDPRTFMADYVKMVPLELVVRRIATGSYLKRNPGVAEGEHLPELLVEFYEKDDTSSPPEAGDDTMNDPLVIFDFVSRRLLRYKPKQPMEVGFIDERPFGQVAWIEQLGLVPDTIVRLRNLAADVFVILEVAWAEQNVDLVDLKIECGFDRNGKLLVADVIDNDSWRAWPEGKKTLMRDKQRYRDAEQSDDPVIKAEQLRSFKDDYAWVAEATGAFHQAS